MAANKAKAILNGVVGDHLEETGNSLATRMAFYRDGTPLDLSSLRRRRLDEKEQLSPRVCILVHGLTDDESTWTYNNNNNNNDDDEKDDGVDYGQKLQQELGITPFYVRYNTGLHISTNGQYLRRLMDSFWKAYPLEIKEILFLCHSMGGLVVRSACSVVVENNNSSDSSSPLWLRSVSRVFFLGTPHHGSYWEKAGNVVSSALGAVPRPYMRLAKDVACLRSAGIQDLRFGYVTDHDWQGHDPDSLLTNTKRPTSLPDWVTYYIVTGTVTQNPSHPATLCFGDGLVSTNSALGRSPNAEHDLSTWVSSEHTRQFPGVGHVQLSKNPNVYLQIKEWIIEQGGQSCARRSSTTTISAIMDVDDENETETDISVLSAEDASAKTPDADDESSTAPSATAGKWVQCKGTATLVQTAIDEGASAVERVQHELTDEVYAVLAAAGIPGVRRIQTVQEACVGGIYSIIRGVNYGVGEVAKAICDQMDETSEANNNYRDIQLA